MISNIVQNRFVFSRQNDGSDTDLSTIIPSASKVQVGTIVSLAFQANEASMELLIYPFHSALRTTLKTATAATDTTFELVADATVNNILNGQTIAALDHILLELDDGGWQLISIASVGATAAEIDVNSIAVFDGDTGVRSAAAAGNTAYVLLNEDAIRRYAGTSERQIDIPIACGEQGVPFAISLKSDGDTDEAYFGGLVEYTESRRITAPLTQH